MTPQQAFEKAVATTAVDQDGIAVQPDEDGVFTLVADGSQKTVWPTYVIPEGASEPVAVKVKKFVESNGSTQINSTNIKDPGTYYAVVIPDTSDTVYGSAECLVKFIVTAPSFDGLSVYEKHAGSTSTSDTEFTFDNAAQPVGISINGVDYAYDLKGGSSSSSNKITAAFYNAKGERISDGSVKDAGDYKVVVEGKSGTEFAGAKATLSFTVEQLDLSKASVVVNDVDVDSSAYNDIIAGASVDAIAVSDGFDYDTSASYVTFSADPVSGVGSYSATVAAAEGQDNVIGSKTVSFNAVENKVDASAFKYNGISLGTDYDAGSQPNALNGRVFDLSNKQSFDADDITVDGGYTLDEDYTVTITDEDGNVVADASKAGKYTVTVAMIPGADYALGGKASATFTVINGDFSTASALVTYNGVVKGDNASVEYTGKDVFSGFDFAVKMGKQDLVEGTDYTVSLSCNGKTVDSAVDVASYTATLEGITYEGKITYNFSVVKATINGLRIQGAEEIGGIAYTGSAVTPVIEYTLDDADAIANKTAEWNVLPADQYKVSYADSEGEAVRPENLKEIGTGYVATVSLNSNAKNVKFVSGIDNTLEFDIVDTVAYTDVAADAWYADAVAKAKSNDYMTGIAGTKLFMPEAQITRAEVAQVFANMAGQDKAVAGTEYPTKFADVDQAAWYAKAIAWASQTGVVTGYDDGVTFGTFDNATREQIATMIYRYAKAQGVDVTVSDEAAALAKYSDGASVSEYAKTAMAWCVEQGVFGVDVDTLRPQDFMSRAEMAATAVRVQPTKLA